MSINSISNTPSFFSEEDPRAYLNQLSSDCINKNGWLSYTSQYVIDPPQLEKIARDTSAKIKTALQLVWTPEQYKGFEHKVFAKKSSSGEGWRCIVDQTVISELAKQALEEQVTEIVKKIKEQPDQEYPKYPFLSTASAAFPKLEEIGNLESHPLSSQEMQEIVLLFNEFDSNDSQPGIDNEFTGRRIRWRKEGEIVKNILAQYFSEKSFYPNNTFTITTEDNKNYCIMREANVQKNIPSPPIIANVSSQEARFLIKTLQVHQATVENKIKEQREKFINPLNKFSLIKEKEMKNIEAHLNSICQNASGSTENLVSNLSKFLPEINWYMSKDNSYTVCCLKAGVFSLTNHSKRVSSKPIQLTSDELRCVLVLLNDYLKK